MGFSAPTPKPLTRQRLKSCLTKNRLDISIIPPQIGAFDPFFRANKPIFTTPNFYKREKHLREKIPHAKAGPVSLLIKIIQLMMLVRPSRASQTLWSPQKAALRRCWFREQLCIFIHREENGSWDKISSWNQGVKRDKDAHAGWAPAGAVPDRIFNSRATFHCHSQLSSALFLHTEQRLLPQ